jgi:hypothetical protein
MAALVGGCIYCGGHPLSDEHWLPACFGRFNYELLKDRICVACNGRKGLGALDEAVIRTGPEGVFRALRGISGRGGHKTVNPVYYKAASEQPVRIVATDPMEPAIIWEPFHDAGHGRGRPARQIVVVDEHGARHAIPISLAWTPNVLTSALEHRGLRAAKVIEVYVDPDEVEVVRRLLSPIFPGFVADCFARDGAADSKRMRFEYTIGGVYMRGLAKIAFHYALKFLTEVRGDERAFGPVRDFIRLGLGGVDDFVRDGTGVFSFIPARAKPVRWVHFFAVQSDADGVLGRLQLFVGPEHKPIPWLVQLSRGPIGRTPIARWHVAAYFDDAPRLHGDGELHELPVVTVPSE